MRFREIIRREEYTTDIPQQFRLKPTDGSDSSAGKQQTQAGHNIATYTPSNTAPQFKSTNSVVVPTNIDNRFKSADITAHKDLGNGDNVGGQVSVAKGKGITGLGVNANRQFDNGASLSADLSTDPNNLRNTSVNANLRIPFSS